MAVPNLRPISPNAPLGFLSFEWVGAPSSCALLPPFEFWCREHFCLAL